jgi:hypothetical protein
MNAEPLLVDSACDITGVGIPSSPKLAVERPDVTGPGVVQATPEYSGRGTGIHVALLSIDDFRADRSFAEFRSDCRRLGSNPLVCVVGISDTWTGNGPRSPFYGKVDYFRVAGDTAISGNDQNLQYRAQSRKAKRARRVLRRVGNVHRVIVPESTERLGPS